MPRLTPATAEKRRAHIIAAAMRCFFERGFAATSIDDVCAVAKISKGAFYSHFPSKEAMIYAALAARSAELGPLDASSIEAMADSIFERQISPALGRENSRFGLELMAAAVSDEVLCAGHNANLEGFRDAVAGAIRTLAPHADAAQAASIVEAHLLGALTRNALRPEADPERLRGEVRDLVRALLA